MEVENFDSEASRIPWHAAFIEAIQMELVAYQDMLEFHSEVPITTEPLRIDCIIIKKIKDMIIKKNIATIFRQWNLLEYKSPDDYVSVDDFYKVYAYACLYVSLEKIPITDLTITFIESHYPDKLLKHLKEIRRYTVAETAPGIYTVSGDILPIQIIDNQQLSAEDNLWLKNLSNRLNHGEVRQINEAIARQNKAVQIAAYLYVIANANIKIFEEALYMDYYEPTAELVGVLERTGWIARWEAQGEAKGEEHKALTIARNLVNLGLPFETIVSATQLEPEKVQELYQRSGLRSHQSEADDAPVVRAITCE